MERRYRLQKNKAFQYVYHRGRSAACRDLVMLVAKGRGMKVGFSVSKKVGNAVTAIRSSAACANASGPIWGM